MDALKALIDTVVNLLKMEMTVFGFTISWWSIMIWGMVASLIIYLFVRFFNE